MSLIDLKFIFAVPYDIDARYSWSKEGAKENNASSKTFSK
jgi:hypothetical protein